MHLHIDRMLNSLCPRTKALENTSSKKVYACIFMYYVDTWINFSSTYNALVYRCL